MRTSKLQENGVDIFRRVEEGKVASLEAVKDEDLAAQEPRYGQTMLHFLLRDYVALSASSEEKNDAWLEKVQRYNETIQYILDKNKEVKNIKNSFGMKPLQAMSSWCPIFVGNPSRATQQQRGAFDMMIRTAETLTDGSSDGDKESIETIKSKLSLN